MTKGISAEGAKARARKAAETRATRYRNEMLRDYEQRLAKAMRKTASHRGALFGPKDELITAGEEWHLDSARDSFKYALRVSEDLRRMDGAAFASFLDRMMRPVDVDAADLAEIRQLFAARPRRHAGGRP